MEYYKPDRPITLSVDASSKGLGAVLIQDEHPIAYASKSLSSTQQNYTQIEKEMLAVVFGCTKFHDYIYGISNVTVESDHKRLEAILKKPPVSSTTPTTKDDNDNPEIFNRAFLQDDENLEEKFDVNALSIISMSDEKLVRLKEATYSDASITAIISRDQNRLAIQQTRGSKRVLTILELL